MADHRREQILAAVTAAVTGLATTGANVQRGRVYPVAEGVDTALTVYQGADAPVDALDLNWHLTDRALVVYVEAHARAAAGVLDGVLNQVEKEVVIALEASPTLGLDFVYDLEQGESEEPELSGEGAKPVGSLRMHWAVKYRRSRTDPSA